MAKKRQPELTKKRIIDVATDLFMSKGFEGTEIQDILNELGDITKGAIYHHFESKEDIFNAVATKIGNRNIELLDVIKEDKNLNGKEKLEQLVKVGLNSENTMDVMNMTTSFLDNPKFLSLMFKQIREISVPEYVYPIIEEGVADGSIVTKDPKELSELIMLLINIWINPLVFNVTEKDELKSKCQMINDILSKYNLVLFDEEILSQMK
ncbi:MAG: TetR/AcrR family transcriptional regulator [Eubacteriales bacterium]